MRKRSVKKLFLPELNDCDSSPCGEHGSCTDLILQYKCTCAAGFTGELCSVGKYIPCAKKNHWLGDAISLLGNGVPSQTVH